VIEVVEGRNTEDHVDVGKSEISVEDQHSLAHGGKDISEVGDDRGLAHAALAAGY
jgi:hypothetical protein